LKKEVVNVWERFFLGRKPVFENAEVIIYKL
jgi:hypothetical protein